MKVRFTRTVLVEIQKKDMEIWDKQMSRWDELMVETVDVSGKFATLTTFDGDVYLNVPADSFVPFK